MANGNRKDTGEQITDAERTYRKRLGRHHDELRWLYMELYDNSSMFAELADNMERFCRERNQALKSMDLERENCHYHGNHMAYGCYQGCKAAEEAA